MQTDTSLGSVFQKAHKLFLVSVNVTLKGQELLVCSDDDHSSKLYGTKITNKTCNAKAASKEMDEEVKREKRQHTSRHFVCVAIQDGPLINIGSNCFCITSTWHPIYAAVPTWIVFSITPSIFIHLSQQDETFKKKEKHEKRSAPYHSNTSSWLLSSMLVNNFFERFKRYLWITRNSVADFYFCPKNLALFQKVLYILESSLLFSFVLNICVLICVWLLSKEPHITYNKVIN